MQLPSSVGTTVANYILLIAASVMFLPSRPVEEASLRHNAVAIFSWHHSSKLYTANSCFCYEQHICDLMFAVSYLSIDILPN